MESNPAATDGQTTCDQAKGPLEVIETLLASDSLSDDARAALLQLRRVDQDLASMSVEELSRLLLKCAS